MILNHAKDIRFGEKSVVSILWHSCIIWPEEYMPVMKNVIGYFNYIDGFSKSSWKNQTGGADMTFTGTVTYMGDSIRISAGAYGSFLMDAFPESYTIYCIAKAEAVGSTGQYLCSNYYNKSGVEGGIEISPGWSTGTKLAFRSIAQKDLITEYSAGEYHVCAVSVTGSVGRCFVDGTFVGTLDVSQAVVNALYLGRRAQSYDNASTYSSFANFYKFFAFAESAHTDAEILRNMDWLWDNGTDAIQTWSDLFVYTWDEVKKFTWEQLKKG